MATITGPFFADIAGVGQADSGEIVYITILGTDGTRQPILFSYKIVPKLIAAILAGAKMAAGARIKKFGAEAVADAMLGIQMLKVQSIAVDMTKSQYAGVLILHVDLQDKGSLDLALPPEPAARLAEGLRQAASKTEELPRLKPN